MDAKFHPAIAAINSGDVDWLRALIRADAALATSRSSTSHPTQTKNAVGTAIACINAEPPSRRDREGFLGFVSASPIPVLVQGASMPAEALLPESLRPLAYRHAIPVRPDPDFNVDLDRLMRGMEAQFGTSSAVS